MSAATISRPGSARPAAQAPSLIRLVRVELRKAVDTRAGFWLLTAIALLAVAISVIRLFAGEQRSRTLDSMIESSQVPAGILLSVVGILLVTSEFSQRTALTTFSLVPHRGRVITAKLLAMLVLAVEVTLAGLVAGVAGFAVSDLLGRASGGWHLGAALIPNLLLYQCLNMLLGAAFGVVLLNSAAAIVLSFVLPIVWAIVTSLISWLRTSAEWLNPARTLTPLSEAAALTGQEWARLGTSLCLWLLLPMAIGLWRLHRKEIS